MSGPVTSRSDLAQTTPATVAGLQQTWRYLRDKFNQADDRDEREAIRRCMWAVEDGLATIATLYNEVNP